jgi:hypothetical protein
MIRFSCYRSPLEHVKIWLEQEHEVEPSFKAGHIVDGFIDLFRDLLNVNQYTYSRAGNHPNNIYFRKAKAYLQSKMENTAVVSLLRSPKDNHILRGSTRIPLKVKRKDGFTYTIKPYDVINPDLEKEVLKKLNTDSELRPLIGPRLLHLGDEFYSEELIDLSKYNNLRDIALDTGAFSLEKREELHDYMFGNRSADRDTRDQLMRNMAEAAKPAIIKGAKLHADLAREGVIYGHDHWLDEFLVSDERDPKIIDFGTAHFFFDKKTVDEELPKIIGKYEELKKDAKWVRLPADEKEEYFDLCDKKHKMEKYQQEYKYLSCMSLEDMFASGSSNSATDKLTFDINILKEDLELTANLFYVISSTYSGMKQFFEGVAIGSGVDYIQDVQTDFKIAFLNRFFSKQ